jgi:dipeptidase
MLKHMVEQTVHPGRNVISPNQTRCRHSTPDGETAPASQLIERGLSTLKCLHQSVRNWNRNKVIYNRNNDSNQYDILEIEILI